MLSYFRDTISKPHGISKLKTAADGDDDDGDCDYHQRIIQTRWKAKSIVYLKIDKILQPNGAHKNMNENKAKKS